MPGLYIHIPLCKQRCAYCDFFKSTDVTLKAPLLDALKREMEFRRDAVPGAKPDTIYIGGGTPSLLSPEQLRSLHDKASGLWDCNGLKEATVEANPEDLTDDYAARLALAGFNRLSIGIQSFDDGLLKLMNRRHTAQRARDAVSAARREGFGNITVDLIFGIPGMTGAQWERSLDEAVGLGVQHISAYHLTIEPGTLFGRMAAEGRIVPVDDAESERLYETLRRKLGDAGFDHYEISNFALPGFRAVHNSAYWSGGPYLGIGPSAHSYDGCRTRTRVVASTAEYIAGAGSGAVYETETLSDKDLYNELVMTSLRRSDGLDISVLEQKHGRPMKDHFLRSAERFLHSGDMLRKGNIFTIPAEKFLLSDYIMSSLFTL